MKQRNPTTRLASVAIVALLLLSASAVLAARGGGSTTAPNATLVFDDLSGDAIGSDGKGAYDATIENGILTVETGRKRAFYLDFSNLLYGEGAHPLGNSDAGTVSQATLSIVPGTGTATIAFQGTGGEHLLATTVDVTAIDDDGDGTVDRYVVATTDEAVHALFVLKKRSGRGTEPGSSHYVWLGSYSMPWGAEADAR